MLTLAQIGALAALLEHHVAAGRLELAEQLVLHMDAAKLNLNDVGFDDRDAETHEGLVTWPPLNATSFPRALCVYPAIAPLP